MEDSSSSETSSSTKTHQQILVEAKEATIIRSNSKDGNYKLRAFNENISALEADHWLQTPQLPHSLNVSTLSSELVNETLNYFVNCGKRLTQMTKTYDDNDAYILLLQEKEVDLELAARIGQDLLRQNKELKESVASLKEELDKRQDHVQQLKHELASKTVLLDTFMEEEEEQEQENQSSLDESEHQLLTLRCHEQLAATATSTTNKHSSQPLAAHLAASAATDHTDDENQNRFLSLNYNSPKPNPCFPPEPFSSLPHYLYMNEPSAASKLPQRQVDCDDSSSTLSEEELNSSCPVGPKGADRKQEQPEIVKTVTFQLVESNKRLCELQDELFYKSEQNSMQQEKIHTLQEQLRETDRRLGDVASENETLLRSMDETKEIHKELSEELKLCKRNFNDLLRVFLAMQKESRILRNETIQRNSNLTYFGEVETEDNFSNVSFDSFYKTAVNPYNRSTPCESCNGFKPVTNSSSTETTTRTNVSASPSLLEELQETLRMKDNQGGLISELSDEQSETAYENDSGVIVNHISTSATPTTYTLTDTEIEDQHQPSGGENSRNWLGFSSFVLTTILLLCISLTFKSSPNGSLPRKLQLKLD